MPAVPKKGLLGPPQHTNRLGIIFVGNPLMSDDGIGIRIMLEMQRMVLPEGAKLFDAGTNYPAIIHMLDGSDMALIVDAVDFGGHPGEVHLFHPEDAVSLKRMDNMSGHWGDVLGVIGLSRALSGDYKDITIAGVQPGDLTFGEGLSEAVEERVPEIVVSIMHAIEDMSSMKVNICNRSEYCRS